MSVERPVKLRVCDRPLDAVAFATNPRRVSVEGPVSPRFVEALVRGASAAGLPQEWIARLSAAAS